MGSSWAALILVGAAAIFAVGFAIGRATKRLPVRKPSTEIRMVGYEKSDVMRLDIIFGTENVDPQSWGTIKLGPLTDKDLSEIAGRFHDDTLRTEDIASLLLELKRIRLKEEK